MTDTTDYDYWNAELKSPGCMSRDSTTVIPAGFWRAVGADTRSDYPVAIYRAKDGTLIFYVGADAKKAVPWDSEPGYSFRAKTWLHARAVSYEDWQQAISLGNWPDGKPINSTVEHVSLRNALPETGDAFTDLTRQFDDDAEMARSILNKPIASQAAADQAAAYAKRLAAIKTQADAAFDAEKRPILERGRECDDKWRPLRGGADDLVKKLKSAAGAWLDKLRREEEERQRLARAEAERLRREAAEKAAKAEAERRAAEQKRLDEERAALAAATSEADQERVAAEAERKRIADEEAQAKAEAEAKAAAEAAEAAEIAATRENKASAGRTGAKISQRKVPTAVIDDYRAALDFFADADAVKEVVQTLATRAIKAGLSVPGVRKVDVYQTV